MGRTKQSPKGPHPVDIHVGEKLRARRRDMNVSQEYLAEKCGVSFQQIQKYERGANRVSCSMLVKIAGALKTPASYFLPDDAAPVPVRDSYSEAQRILQSIPGSIEALRALDAIDGAGRAHLIAMMRLITSRHESPKANAA